MQLRAMQIQRLKVGGFSRAWIGICVVTLVLLTFAFGVLVWPPIEERMFDPRLPDWVNWALGVPLILFASVMLLAVWHGALVQFSTRFTNDGVVQYQPFRRVFISWSGVREANATLRSIEIVSEEDSIRITLVLYRDPERLLHVLRSRLPSGI